MGNPPLAAAAELFQIEEASLTSLRGGNFANVHGFTRGGQDWVLRLLPPSDDTELRGQQAILAWMDHLAKNGASVPAPMRSRNGRLVEPITTPEGVWLALVFSRAPGILAEELPIDEWKDEHFQLLGRTLGKMHALAVNHTPPSGYERPGWNKSGNLFNHAIDPALPGHERKQSRFLEHLSGLPKPADAYGMIHADFHFANFFIDKGTGTVTPIDFDDCTLGWFIMDLAVLIFDAMVNFDGQQREEFARLFTENFLLGYAQEKAISLFWLEQIPMLLKLLEINVYSVVYKSFELGKGDTWVNKFMPGRKESIENETPYISLDFGRIWEQIHSGTATTIPAR
ncbi:MAG: phosphotransferase [Anaerolineales bacterium]